MELFHACQMKSEAACSGNLHEVESHVLGLKAGTMVRTGEIQKATFCEAHYPVPEDPTFRSCSCRLCRERGGN